MGTEIKKFNESVVTLQNRNILSITGVESVTSMSETAVMLHALGSAMTVNGTNMQVLKLDVENGILKIGGIIDNIKYNAKKANLFKRIFK